MVDVVEEFVVASGDIELVAVLVAIVYVKEKGRLEDIGSRFSSVCA